jgi:hypothetical protein
MSSNTSFACIVESYDSTCQRLDYLNKTPKELGTPTGCHTLRENDLPIFLLGSSVNVRDVYGCFSNCPSPSATKVHRLQSRSFRNSVPRIASSSVVVRHLTSVEDVAVLSPWKRDRFGVKPWCVYSIFSFSPIPFAVLRSCSGSEQRELLGRSRPLTDGGIGISPICTRWMTLR